MTNYHRSNDQSLSTYQQFDPSLLPPVTTSSASQIHLSADPQSLFFHNYYHLHTLQRKDGGHRLETAKIRLVYRAQPPLHLNHNIRGDQPESYSKHYARNTDKWRVNVGPF
ncbi:hypothetical protein WG66_013958 [Moniliophthora roreri]|nr:hypothetical protein WG66_013958 [Moniliophthora roreri]